MWQLSVNRPRIYGPTRLRTAVGAVAIAPVATLAASMVVRLPHRGKSCQTAERVYGSAVDIDF